MFESNDCINWLATCHLTYCQSMSIEAPRETRMDPSCFRDGSFCQTKLLPLGLVVSDSFCHLVPWRPCCYSPSPLIVLGRSYWKSFITVFTYSASMHRQQSIITEPSAEHSMTYYSPWWMISLYVITSYFAAISTPIWLQMDVRWQIYVAIRTATRKPYRRSSAFTI